MSANTLSDSKSYVEPDVKQRATTKGIAKGIYVSGTGPAIVFLHSSLSSSRQWLPLVKQLENHFTCINVDILGYGGADRVSDPENYSFDVEIARIKQALAAVIGNGSYHLVGHSCGGAIALKLAVEAPQRVLSLSLFEPVAFNLLPAGSELRNVADEFANRVDIEDKFKAAEVFTDFWNMKGFFQSLPDKMQALMANDMAKVTLDFKGLISASYSLANVAEIKAPTLFLTGKYSPQLSHSLAETIIGSLPNVKSVEVEAGHMAPVSHGKLVLPIIADFIQQHAENH
ncbi:alpha/beta fold hydrolase [Thalassotalea euphylliae]|uniref:Alpha/beta fold hydrolase n=1 Tax=Thalassotalea euphylliae TaxID=1655234 RepID=A0A3E0U663_9GAMM|nr:alpha/beta hydrolase [Thalassotalea euphylliae]REL32260.1 alpha/beta fold hydrolase [Thalassotalea euphylliae]